MKILGAIWGAALLIGLTFLIFVVAAFIGWNWDHLFDPTIMRIFLVEGVVGAMIGAALAD